MSTCSWHCWKNNSDLCCVSFIINEKCTYYVFWFSDCLHRIRTHLSHTYLGWLLIGWLPFRASDWWLMYDVKSILVNYWKFINLQTLFWISITVTIKFVNNLSFLCRISSGQITGTHFIQSKLTHLYTQKSFHVSLGNIRFYWLYNGCKQ